MKKIVSSIIVISALLAAIYVIRPHNSFLLTMIPPTDLYDSIAVIDIDLEKGKEYDEFTITHRYKGTYAFGIFIERIPEYGTPVESEATLHFELKNNSKSLFKATTSKWSSRFGGPGKKEAGVILGSYKVPDDIAPGNAVTVTISLVKNDDKFEEHYGKQTFFIRRLSDK